MVATILSGGNNRRMLRNKAFLQIGQKAIIEREIEVFSTLFSRVIVVTNAPENHAHLAAEVVPDPTRITRFTPAFRRAHSAAARTCAA